MITKPTCADQGLIPGLGMCGAVIVGGKLCGHEGACDHQRPASQWTAPLQQLRDALGKGGSDPQIQSAISLVECAATYPERHLDTRLGGNCPTYREAVAAALATVPHSTAG